MKKLHLPKEKKSALQYGLDVFVNAWFLEAFFMFFNGSRTCLGDNVHLLAVGIRIGALL